MADEQSEEGQHNKTLVTEILRLLPNYEEKNVVAVGNCLGKYVKEFESSAKLVVILNNQLKNQAGDKPSADGYDLVFSNSLLMDKNDNEVCSLFKSILSWLKVGGLLFFVEQCSLTGANATPADSTVTFRHPAHYNALYQSVNGFDFGSTFGFDLVYSRSITGVHKDEGMSQICWILEKIQKEEEEAHGYTTFQEFLDNQQYSRNGILRYEKIFGKHFVSTGGKETTEEFVKMLNLKSGEDVLDVGSGIGGSAFFMAENYNVNVLGIDLSANMIAIGWERLQEINDKRVQFEISDATKREFEDAAFDVVYSRDTILHIKDKKSLFSRFYKWLKPGGRVLISDYCCSAGEHTAAFTDYVAQRGYHLLTPDQYGKVLEEVGFTDVQAMDKTNQFVEVLERELNWTESNKSEFIQDFSRKDYDAILGGWNDKLVRCQEGNGNQRWGLFIGYKI